MPDYNRPPQQRQNMPMHGDEKHHMSMAEKKNALRECIDDICTYIYSGVHYHQKAANCLRAMALRGFARMNEHLAKVEFEELQDLEKLSTDKLEHVPHVDMEKVVKAESWEMSDMNAFKAHFGEWMNREAMYADCINEAIHYARYVDVQIYGELVCLADRFQEEIFRARLLADRLTLGGWTGADIALVSQTIHEYYEHGEIDPKHPMDYNLG